MPGQFGFLGVGATDPIKPLFVQLRSACRGSFNVYSQKCSITTVLINQTLWLLFDRRIFCDLLQISNLVLFGLGDLMWSKDVFDGTLKCQICEVFFESNFPPVRLQLNPICSIQFRGPY